MYAIKADLANADLDGWAFDRQKTMYGGKLVAVGDVIFVFASENAGGSGSAAGGLVAGGLVAGGLVARGLVAGGLVARGVVTAVTATPRLQGVERQTPRVSIQVQRTAGAKRRLGRTELRVWKEWDDGRPETELNFKFYRQATNKIVGLSAATGAYLEGFF